MTAADRRLQQRGTRSPLPRVPGAVRRGPIGRVEDDALPRGDTREGLAHARLQPVLGARLVDDGPLVEAKHVRLAGGVRQAFERAARAVGGMPVQVEVSSLGELQEALEAGAPRVLVTDALRGELDEVVRLAGGRAQIEYSALRPPEGFDAIAASGVDFVSIAALTAAPGAVDLSFEFEAI